MTVTATDDTGATATSTTTVEVEAPIPAGAIDPSTTIEFEAQSNNEWTGVAPSQIAEDNPNPELTLAAGETDTIEWTNVNGAYHNFYISDDSGTTFVESDGTTGSGPVETIEVTATEGMAVYYCNPHRTFGMEGSIDIV